MEVDGLLDLVFLFFKAREWGSCFFDSLIDEVVVGFEVSCTFTGSSSGLSIDCFTGTFLVDGGGIIPKSLTFFFQSIQSTKLISLRKAQHVSVDFYSICN